MRRAGGSSAQRAASENTDEVPDSNVHIIFEKSKDPTTVPYQHLPENLRVTVSEDVWSGYSQIRRDSFCRMLANPNSFFYRNRPPGDPQRFGSFTQDEEEAFLKRLRYFREDLHIEDGLWGLFAVPLRGRVGYQCSSFYRSLIHGQKVEDSKYEVDGGGKLVFQRGQGRSIPESSMRILEQEAIEFVAQCMNRDGAVVKDPVRVDPRTGEESTVKKVRRPIGPGPKACDLSRPVVVGARTARTERMRKKKDWNWERELAHDEWSCLLYGKDSVTGQPMLAPLMDTTSGIVLDATTWEGILDGTVQCTLEHFAESVEDLVPMTKRWFEQYRLKVANVSW
jgi:hypothetical protein